MWSFRKSRRIKTVFKMIKYLIALTIMLKAHWKQKDKANKWYIYHPLRVSFKMKTLDLKIIALLHDVVEDSNITLKQLSKYFNNEVIESVCAITRNPNEKYFDYIKRVKLNDKATLVKIEDLKQNLDISKIKNITKYDVSRCKKYKKALIYLEH